MSCPVALKEVVGDVMQGLVCCDKSDKRAIVEGINSILDKRTLRHIKISAYRDNKLFIDVDSSAWLYKLNLEKKSIIASLHKAMPDAEIKDLVLRLG